jgi:DNA-3-methyladenine glycosylase
VDLLGCVLIQDSPEGTASGLIVETEAYRPEDPACHAYRGPTMRNRTMFGGPGLAYVYLSYGVHNLLNIVCEREGVGSAVLIRALRPLGGLELMRRRRGRESALCNGPGKLTQALGIDLSHDGHDLLSGSGLAISPGEQPEGEIVATTRVGITRGTELPWRYLILGEENVSVPLGLAVERGLHRSGWTLRSPL